MNSAEQATIAIVGAGSLGVALACWLRNSNQNVVLGSRDPSAKADQLRQFNDECDSALPIASYEEVVAEASLIIFTVPDSHIARVASELLSDAPAAAIVAHCSGAMNSSTLSASTRADQSVCSLHPLNTFPNLRAAMRLASEPRHQTTLVCEGDDTALDFVTPIFEGAGFKIQTIDAAVKPLYHAASVMICNYLTVLMEAGLKTAELAGLNRSVYWQSVQPLIAGTLANVGSQQSLSGPVARGDLDTLIKHLEGLSQHSHELRDLYVHLGAAAARLAQTQGSLDHQQTDSVVQLLQESLTKH